VDIEQPELSRAPTQQADPESWEEEEAQEEQVEEAGSRAPEPNQAPDASHMPQPPPKDAIPNREEIIRPPSGSEREAMEAIKEANGADQFRIGRRIGVSVAYADMLCRALIKKGLLSRDTSGIHRLTPRGEQAVAPDG